MFALPIIPQAKPSQILVVSIISLSEERQNAFESTIHKALASSEVKGAKEPVFAYTRAKLPSDKEHSQVNESTLVAQSSIKRIYQTASIAEDSGWKEIAIFDFLSLIQLEGKARYKNGFHPTVVLVGFRKQTHENRSVKETDPVHMVAVRTSVDSGISNLASDNPKIVISQKFDKEDMLHFNQEWYTRGTIVRDPESPAVLDGSSLATGQSTRAKTIEAAMEKPPSLPMEIRREIYDILERVDAPLEDKTAAPKRLKFSPYTIEIHLLEKLPENELEELQKSVEAKIKETNSEMSCLLYEWIYSEPATRLDVARLWNRIVGWNQPSPSGITKIMTFMYPKLWRDHRKIGLLENPYLGEPLLLRKETIETAVDTWPRRCDKEKFPTPGDGTIRSWKDPEKGGNGEILFRPYDPFYAYSPPWNSQTKKHWSAPAAFFLTNNYSDQEYKMLMNEMCKTLDEAERGDREYRHDKEFSWWHWEQEEDGTIEDMWRIFRELHTYERGGDRTEQMIMVDRQSFEDLTVLLVERLFQCDDPDLAEERRETYGDYMGEDPYKTIGIRYGRISGRRCCIAWINLDIANMDLEELIDAEIQYYKPAGGTRLMGEDEDPDESIQILKVPPR